MLTAHSLSSTPFTCVRWQVLYHSYLQASEAFTEAQCLLVGAECAMLLLGHGF